MNEDKIEVIHKAWRNNDGLQRNEYLRYLNEGDWCLVLDADEVISDNCHDLRMVMEKAEKTNGPFVLNPHMVHFVYHLGLVDGRQQRHYCPRRFFRYAKGMYYDTIQHPILKGFYEGKGIPNLDLVTIFHYSRVKGIQHSIKMYPINLKRSKATHNPELAKQLLDWDVWGKYPVAPSPYKLKDHPTCVQELLL